MRSWICLLLGHKWIETCNYRIFRQELRSGSGKAQLACERCGTWVTVSRRTFNKYYETFCVVQEQPIEGIEYEEEVCEECGLVHE